MPEFTDEQKQILRKHVSNLDRDVYLVYNLPPEVVAVLFAYVSRSPASFRENLLKLILGKELDMGRLIEVNQDQGLDYQEAREKAMKFHEKWVVGYGHGSVAEHAMASIALENISILATKVVEDNRLASYTEKSTRYQVFDRNRYYKPKRLMESRFGKLYEDTCNHLFDVYVELTPHMFEYMRKKYPKPEEMKDGLYESVTKARACDAIRYLLPASTLTNLGMTVNARNLEHAIRKLLSHPLEEMRDMGTDIKTEVQKVIPVLVKYAEYNKYIHDTNQGMEKHQIQDTPQNNDVVRLVEYDRDAENKIVSSILYKYSKNPYQQIREKVAGMSQEGKKKVLDDYLKGMDRHDWPMRELEHTNYTFDILMDYGAFRDVQRHRICTQTNQDVTTDHDYEIPQDLVDAGFKDKFVECMEKARHAFEEIRKEFPKDAQYVVPLAYKKRTLIAWNLRSLCHFIKLRSSKQGHESYRRIARMCYQEVKKVHPLLAEYIQVDMSEGPARG
ncbi:MAG: FAD-dependent thymidylate synthase [Candidatus Aenigmatarchaeota archaeon]